MSILGEEVPTVTSEDFGFKKLGQATILPSYNEVLPFASLQNFDISNEESMYVAASGGKTVIGQLQLLRDFIQNQNDTQLSFLWEKEMDGIIMVKFLPDHKVIAISREGSVFIIDYKKDDLREIYAFDKPLFQVKLFQSNTLIAINTSSQVFSLELTDLKFSPELANNVVAFDIFENQVYLFSKDYSIQTLTSSSQKLELRSNFSTPPELVQEFADQYHPLCISVLNEDQLLLIFGEVVSETDDDVMYDHKMYIVKNLANNPTFEESFDITPAFGSVLRHPSPYNIMMRDLTPGHKVINILAAACSSEVTIWDSAEVVQPSQDSERAVLPISKVTDNDTNPIGVALDITTSGTISDPCPGVDTIDKLPLIYILNNEGSLQIVGLYHSSAIKQGSFNVQDIATESRIAEKKSDGESATTSRDYADGENLQSSKVEKLGFSLGNLSTGGNENKEQSSTLKEVLISDEDKTPLETNDPSNPLKEPSSGISQLKPVFGSNDAKEASEKLSFGKLETNTAFGKPSFGNTGSNSAFGNPSFGNTGSSSAFGKPSFGSTESSSPFGKPSFGNTESSSPFGKPSFGNSGSNPAFGKPSFGSTESSSAFGKPSFGNTGSNPAFGKPSFGSTESSPAIGKSPFNSSDTKSVFGRPSFGNLESKTSFDKQSSGSSEGGLASDSSSATNARNNLQFGSSSFGGSASKPKFGGSGSESPFQASPFGSSESKPLFGAPSFGSSDSKAAFGKTSFGNFNKNDTKNPETAFNNSAFGKFAGENPFTSSKGTQSPFAKLTASGGQSSMASPFASLIQSESKEGKQDTHETNTRNNGDEGFESESEPDIESENDNFESEENTSDALKGSKEDSTLEESDIIEQDQNSNVVESEDLEERENSTTADLSDSTIEQTPSVEIRTKSGKPDVKSSISAITARIKQNANLSTDDLKLSEFESGSPSVSKNSASPFSAFTGDLKKSSSQSFSFANLSSHREGKEGHGSGEESNFRKDDISKSTSDSKSKSSSDESDDNQQHDEADAAESSGEDADTNATRDKDKDTVAEKENISDIDKAAPKIAECQSDAQPLSEDEKAPIREIQSTTVNDLNDLNSQESNAALKDDEQNLLAEEDCQSSTSNEDSREESYDALDDVTQGELQAVMDGERRQTTDIDNISVSEEAIPLEKIEVKSGREYSSQSIQTPEVSDTACQTDNVLESDFQVQTFEKEESYLATQYKPKALPSYFTGADIDKLHYVSQDPTMRSIERTYQIVSAEFSVLRDNIQNMNVFIEDQSTCFLQNRSEKTIANLYTWRIPESEKLQTILSQDLQAFVEQANKIQTLDEELSQYEQNRMKPLQHELSRAKYERYQCETFYTCPKVDELKYHQSRMQADLRRKMSSIAETTEKAERLLQVLKLYTIENKEIEDNPFVNQLARDSSDRRNLVDEVVRLREEVQRLNLSDKTEQSQESCSTEHSLMKDEIESASVVEVGLIMNTKKQIGDFFKKGSTLGA